MRNEHHTIVALVEDRPGVLNRIASKWRQRGFNIESLAVGHSETPGLSRMTFVVDAGTTDVKQVVNQVGKLIDIVHIEDITEHEVVSRELVMVKVKCSPENRSQILQIVDIFRANIVDVTPETIIVEATGDGDKLDSLMTLLSEFGVIELCRTGSIAMPRGVKRIAPEEAPHVVLPNLSGGRAPGGIF